MDLICAGEAMAELLQSSAGTCVGFAGDSFNTAVYAKRQLGRSARVGFLTRYGTDPMSKGLRALAAKEEIEWLAPNPHESRNLGIYSVSTDAAGERSFHYWREQSAARLLFSDATDLALFSDCAVAYLSGITLAILSADARESLYASLQQFRAGGGKLAFDSNYRPRLWQDRETAQAQIGRLWQITDIALPSVDDEMALFGDVDDQSVLARLRSAGCQLGALKRGASGPLSINGSVPDTLQLPLASRVVDTTAAGDSFNGGYLAGLIQGLPEVACIENAHATALQVIAQPGAIIARENSPV